MNITVIGHGNVGGALINKWAKKGHQITVGAKNPDDEKLPELVKNENVKVAGIPESIDESDVIVIAIPAHLTTELANSLGDLSSKIVIDTTNSVFRKPGPYHNAFEAFQRITNAKVAKCFNSTGFGNMKDPYYPIEGHTEKIPIDMFVAGSDEEAKKVATQLAEDIGCVVYDFGGDEQVGLLEELCRVWINLSTKIGRDFAFKLLHR